MNFYVHLIGEAVDWIETQLESPLHISDLARHSNLSDYHLSRIFSAVAGVPAGQYIQGRKLTRAVELLTKTQDTVTDIALRLGFEYPEVFSRCFKKQFGISPSRFRALRPSVSVIPKAVLHERELISIRGTLALRAECIYMNEKTLSGVVAPADTNSSSYQDDLVQSTEPFIRATSGDPCFDQSCFYTTVLCSGKNDGVYSVFCGRMPLCPNETNFSQKTIPSGWWASFDYTGDMRDIQETFMDDLYKWVIARQARLAQNGVGMLTIYSGNYPKDNKLQILVPIEQPV